MQNARLDKAPAGIKIASRNINNLRYADLKNDRMISVHFQGKPFHVTVIQVYAPISNAEEAGLKLNIQKTKIMTSGPIASWQTDAETMETVIDFIFLDSKITAHGTCSHEIKTLGFL